MPLYVVLLLGRLCKCSVTVEQNIFHDILLNNNGKHCIFNVRKLSFLWLLCVELELYVSDEY